MVTLDDWIYKHQFDMQNEHSAYWHNKSCHLLKSSEILWKAWCQNEILDGGDTYLMLMGLSLELLLKSFYVAKEMKPPEKHSLDNLTSECFCNFTNKENVILKVLSGYITWQGRYPTPKNKINKSTGEDTGHHSIRDQTKPFENTIGITSQLAGKSNSVLNRSDLDFENLLCIWKKINEEYLSRYIKPA